MVSEALSSVVLVLATEAAPLVALLPPAADPGLEGLAQLIAARASEVVEAAGANELHLKQASRALEDAPEAAQDLQAMRGLLGADRLVAFRVRAGVPLTLEVQVLRGAGPVRREVTALDSAWPRALREGSERVARAALGRSPGATAAQPDSDKPRALEALGRCHVVVVGQPFSVEAPMLLDRPALTRAREDCWAAVQEDPKLSFAQATLALAQALLGEDQAAALTLASLPPEAEVLEPATLARFWLLTRYQSNEAGVAFLRDVLSRHPGELLVASALGETLLVEGRFAEAEAAWRAYLRRAPRSVYALVRLSRSLARQGRHAEAIAQVRAALALAPGVAEARLELGSRLIDSGQLPQAVKVLTPLTTRRHPRGEHLLRLGMAQYLLGALDAAGASFEKAAALATSPAEWRTRGKALYELALVHLTRGRRPEARAAYQASLESGYRHRDVDPLLQQVTADLDRERLRVPDAGVAPPAGETSLFRLDPFGELDIDAAKPPAPEGLILHRF